MRYTGRISTKLVEAKLDAAARRAVKQAAEHVLGESQKQVPLEESTLQRSGATNVDDKGDEIVGTVSYDTPYAVVQHENLSYRHDAGRNAKYLERPLYAEVASVYRILALAMRRAL